jgi:hypothetical protein
MREAIPDYRALAPDDDGAAHVEIRKAQLRQKNSWEKFFDRRH